MSYKVTLGKLFRKKVNYTNAYVLTFDHGIMQVSGYRYRRPEMRRAGLN